MYYSHMIQQYLFVCKYIPTAPASIFKNLQFRHPVEISNRTYRAVSPPMPGCTLPRAFRNTSLQQVWRFS